MVYSHTEIFPWIRQSTFSFLHHVVSSSIIGRKFLLININGRYSSLLVCASYRVPYMLNLLPYYLSIANSTGGEGIFELLVFKCFV